MTEAELKPCPWCATEWVKVRSENGACFCAECQDCASMGPEAGTYNEAIAVWNTRAQPGGADGWLPIESAPKDGRFVLLHCPNGQLESGDVTIGAYWKEDERAENGRFLKGHWDGWLGMDADIASSWCNPTHWRPLPPAPLSQR